jgi:hypothetical protein
MQRMAWTDERLEERFDRIELRFDVVDRRFDEMDRESERRFHEIDRRLGYVESGMSDLRAVLTRFGTGMIVSLFGVIAAILVKGG